uniref:Uncharacterized protein n=1 Tax=uncultured planctomycete 6FN TaxID=455068 RepID=A9LGZ9_9BACT|nr:hypothetical protein 6FN_19 [uncultured planctomycete 6FN]
MQHGCVQVMEVHFIFYGSNSILVSRTHSLATFNSSASHPCRKSCGIVIATIFFLNVRRSTELTSPNHQSIFQHPSLFQIRK